MVGSLLDRLFFRGGISKGLIYLPLERVRMFGKIYLEKHGNRNVIVNIADPEDAELVMRKETSYPERFNTPLFEYFWTKYNREPGVFFLNGIKWYRQRSALSKQMLIPRSIAQYTPEMNRISSEFVARLKTLRAPEGSSTNHEVGNIDNELFKWFFESVAFALFEKRFGSIGDQIDPKAQEFIQATGMFFEALVPTAISLQRFMIITRLNPTRNLHLLTKRCTSLQNFLLSSKFLNISKLKLKMICRKSVVCYSIYYLRKN